MIVLIIFHIISTDEDPGLRIESFAVINLRGVSTNKTIIFYRHANIQRTYYIGIICELNFLCTLPFFVLLGEWFFYFF
jgi:hypothetical protein